MNRCQCVVVATLGCSQHFILGSYDSFMKGVIVWVLRPRLRQRKKAKSANED